MTDSFETNGNYGFTLPRRDCFFGTYKDQPDKEHTDMVIGLSQFRIYEKGVFDEWGWDSRYSDLPL